MGLMLVAINSYEQMRISGVKSEIHKQKQIMLALGFGSSSPTGLLCLSRFVGSSF
jgi:hypothetical protein